MMIYKLNEFDDNIELIKSILNYIQKELNRCYYNKNQKQMTNSPFENTAATYSNNTFTVRAYDWSGNLQPNFECDGFKVWWYKHSNRGVHVESDKRITLRLLNSIIKKCIKSIRKDFGEE